MLLNNQGRMTSCVKLNGQPDIKLKIAIQIPKMYPPFVFYQQPLRFLKTNLWQPSENHGKVEKVFTILKSISNSFLSA